MIGLAAFLFPAVLMLFALAMERVQAHLDRDAYQHNENKIAGDVDETPAEDLADLTDMSALTPDGMPHRRAS